MQTIDEIATRSNLLIGRYKEKPLYHLTIWKLSKRLLGGIFVSIIIHRIICRHN